MDVQAAQARQRQQPRRQDEAVGRDHDDVGPRRLERRPCCRRIVGVLVGSGRQLDADPVAEVVVGECLADRGTTEPGPPGGREVRGPTERRRQLREHRQDVRGECHHASTDAVREVVERGHEGVLDARGVEITRAAGAPRKEQVLSALGALA